MRFVDFGRQCRHFEPLPTREIYTRPKGFTLKSLKEIEIINVRSDQ